MTANVTAANIAASNSLAGSGSGLTDWQTEFCDRYAATMLDFGWWFLLAALIIGAIGALVVVWTTLFPTTQDGEGGGASPPALITIIGALKGLIEAFAKAPTWLAMFGGGVLLVWMAGNVVPGYCTGTVSQQEEPDTGSEANGSTAANSQDAAGNAAESEAGG